MAKSKRIAAIDWMRGFVMILMVVDHASMAFNKQHNSTALYISGTVLPEFEFFTRWISHLCAPVFVFLAGTALAISVERKAARGFDSKKIDTDILLRGAFIALLDPTIISLFSGRMTIQVLYAIGVAMMCMALLRRFSSTALLMMVLERVVGVRPNGVLLVFGQTSMMFYLVHRLLLEGSATYGGLRHFADLNTIYMISLVMLVLLYPFCLWYRGFKAQHAQSIWLKYL